MTDTIAKMDDLFKKYVPRSGKADTIAGEIIRAVSKIGYRYYNDGDMLGYWYGNETCNPAARYLLSLGDARITKAIHAIWNGNAHPNDYSPMSDDEYKEGLNRLFDLVLDIIKDNPELTTTPNNDDMWDYATDLDVYSTPDEDGWHDEDEEE